MLADAIRNATAALTSDPDGRVHAYFRRRIWLAIGPRNERSLELITQPHRVRACLALLCGEKVLPIWENRWPRRQLPREVLSRAIECLTRGLPPSTIRSVTDELWTLGEDMQYQFGPGPAPEVAFALSRAAEVVYHDERFEDADAVHEIKDPLNDPWAWDSAYIAAEAWAASASASQGVLPTTRREFWDWYLKSAIGSALQNAAG